MRGSISGRVTLTPKLCSSKQGKPYTNFCVASADGLAACVAFGEVAESICAKVEAGMNIQIAGKSRDDGSVAVSGYYVPKVGGATMAKNYIVAKPEPLRTDYLIKKLGGRYVTKKIREWLRNKPSITKGADVSVKKNGVVTRACGAFDKAGFANLLEELKKEADEVWEPDCTSQSWTEKESEVLF